MILSIGIHFFPGIINCNFDDNLFVVKLIDYTDFLHKNYILKIHFINYECNGLFKLTFIYLIIPSFLYQGAVYKKRLIKVTIYHKGNQGGIITEN